jgi:hypothetical protein
LALTTKSKLTKIPIAFSYAFTFNPDPGNATRQNNVFRIRDVNLYPSGVMANDLGEMAMTGGRLDANITFKPRD